MSKWKIIEERELASFPIFSCGTSTRENPRTGKPFTFFLMNGLNWANIIAITRNDEIVMVEQYRHGVEETTLEIPGGCIEQAENPEDAALRELREETGYSASHIIPLGIVQANPAMQSIHAYSFLALGAVKTDEPKLDEGEDIQIRLLPCRQLMRAISTGEIKHSIVLSAFTLLLSSGPQEVRNSILSE